jgi:hypothetical protein
MLIRRVADRLEAAGMDREESRGVAEGALRAYADRLPTEYNAEVAAALVETIEKDLRPAMAAVMKAVTDAWSGIKPVLDQIARSMQSMSQADFALTGGDELEDRRLELSEAIGLGTGAPWPEIEERAAELHSRLSQNQGDDSTVIEVTAEEFHVGALTSLKKLDLTYADLEYLASTDSFENGNQAALWASVGGTLDRHRMFALEAGHTYSCQTWITETYRHSPGACGEVRMLCADSPRHTYAEPCGDYHENLAEYIRPTVTKPEPEGCIAHGDPDCI